jgi:hypothetical protein
MSNSVNLDVENFENSKIFEKTHVYVKIRLSKTYHVNDMCNFYYRTMFDGHTEEDEETIEKYIDIYNKDITYDGYTYWDVDGKNRQRISTYIFNTETPKKCATNPECPCYEASY